MMVANITGHPGADLINGSCEKAVVNGRAGNRFNYRHAGGAVVDGDAGNYTHLEINA
ncbi:hypothetical protein [Paracoccus sp. Ld10]|uniref:hypothetical protein n=1 Tax=Paracoccus sp. Ld10 TaxID=649158 RepID=UPI00386CB2D6